MRISRARAARDLSYVRWSSAGGRAGGRRGNTLHAQSAALDPRISVESVRNDDDSRPSEQSDALITYRTAPAPPAAVSR